MTNAEYIRTWLKKAENDLKIVDQAVDRPPQDWVGDIICFHCQQAVEKSLKALLILRKIEPPRTHSIEILHEQCKKIDADFPSFDYRNLSFFAVEIRYPDAIYTPDQEETMYYVALAHEIFICSKSGIITIEGWEGENHFHPSAFGLDVHFYDSKTNKRR